MIYVTQDLYQKAMRFAGEKHASQTVPGTDANYLLHISNVTMEVLMAHKANEDFELDLAMQVAILHDTIEDTEADYEEIKDEFGEPVANGVEALTKDGSLPGKKEKMLDSLARIKQQPKEIAIVKLADRITNLQHPPESWHQTKIMNYLEEARLIEHELGDRNAYLSERLKRKITAYQNYIQL